MIQIQKKKKPVPIGGTLKVGGNRAVPVKEYGSREDEAVFDDEFGLDNEDSTDCGPPVDEDEFYDTCDSDDEPPYELIMQKPVLPGSAPSGTCWTPISSAH